MSVRLYGVTYGHGSQAQVTRGVALALGARLAGVVSLDDVGDLEDLEPPDGAGATYGIFTGPPNQVDSLTQNNAHRHRMGMLVPNSNLVPKQLLAFYESCCTELLSPTTWAVKQLRRLTALPVRLAPHGVFDEFVPKDEVRDRLPKERFMVLHLSTSDRERKGTLQLLEAWRKLSWKQAQLNLVLDRAARSALFDALEDRGATFPSGVEIFPRFGGSPEDMARLYSAHHVICQPSRGEGFGLCPLEARACGVPVVATDCTGHYDHMKDSGHEDGVVVVESGGLEPIDDLPGALAPAVKPEAVAEALEAARDGWRALDAAARDKAPDVIKRWSWPSAMATFVNELEE